MQILSDFLGKKDDSGTTRQSADVKEPGDH